MAPDRLNLPIDSSAIEVVVVSDQLEECGLYATATSVEGS